MAFVQISAYNDYVTAHLDKGMLESEQITVWLKDEHTVTIDPILSNAVGGIKLMVPREDADRAIALLQQQRDEYKASMACPYCSSHNITMLNTPRKPENWIMAVFTWLVGNYAISAEVSYKCFNCERSFAEPVRLLKDEDRIAPENS